MIELPSTQIRHPSILRSRVCARKEMNRLVAKSIAVCVIAMFSLLTNANAALIHSFTPDQAYLDHAAAIGGSTVFIEQLNNSGDFVFNATGVHLGGGWVLASAHQALAVNFDRSSIYPGFRIGTGNNYFSNRGSIVDVSDVIIHPDFLDLGRGFDLALFRLSAPLQGVPAASLYTGTIATGMDAHITGFGLTGQIGLTFPAFADGNLRAGNNVINQSTNTSFGDPYFSAGVVNGGSRLRELGYLLLPGDSGGGWFIDVNGELQLAGISSASNATANTHGYGFTGVATKLDVDWINATRATAIPEPSSLCLLLVASAALASKRRRRWSQKSQCFKSERCDSINHETLLSSQSSLRSIVVCVITIFSLAPYANAALIHSTTPDQAYLDHAAAIGGSTVFVERLNSSGDFIFNASGVHIGGGRIAVSAHQLLGVDTDLNSLYGGFRIGTGNNYFNNRGSIYDVTSVFIHPSYRNIGNGYDLAILQLNSLNPNIGTSNLYTGNITAGMEAHITGFGLTGQIGVTFPAVADGNLRAGINSITHSINPSFGNPYFSSRVDERGSQFRNLGFLGLPGDSGGGWFIDVNGELQLAGIFSSGNSTASNHRYGFTNIATRIDIPWSNSTTAVPEPSSIVLLTLGSGIVGLCRRRSAVAANRHQLASTAA